VARGEGIVARGEAVTERPPYVVGGTGS
jgi:hypothetical protein